jgi:monoamine oxidase
MGAQVIHGKRAATWAIVREAQLRVAAITRSDNFVVRMGGQTRAVADLVRAGVAPPWSVAEELTRRHGEDQAVTEILDRLGVHGRTSAITSEWLAQIWAADPAHLSVGGMQSREQGMDPAAGEFVVLDGYDAVPRHLATGLDVRLSAPVASVSWRRGRVRVVAAAHSCLARAAVITVPPAVVAAGGLRVEPALPSSKQAAAAELQSGDGISVVLRSTMLAPRSEWGLRVDDPGGLWRADSGSPLVRGWVKGPAAGKARRRADTLSWASIAADVFGWLRRDAVITAHVVDWGIDPLAMGAFSYPRVGARDSAERWAEPVEGTLFFAGEASCSDRHSGLVSGAIVSGIRAADELLAALGLERHVAARDGQTLDPPPGRE